MGRPYDRELQALEDTLAWALEVDVRVLQDFVDASRGSPLLAVGSGGSVAAAHYAALLHRHQTRGASRHATPLELIMDEPGLTGTAVMMLSASGRNHDVLAAAKSAVEAEVPALGSLSTRKESPLAEKVRAYSRGFAFAEQSPAGKDGYLATNSLLATLVLLARGYRGFSEPLMISPGATALPDIVYRPSAIALYAGWSAPIATDLESRLHESTLMNVQVSDYRNFGHGRHLWLSRRGQETVVLALVTPETAHLAERTLKLIPEDIPVVKVETRATGPAATVELLIRVLHWTGAIAQLQSLDPGRPRVPQFGRKLFHVRPPKKTRTKTPAAVQRKLQRLNTNDPVARKIYRQAFTDLVRRLSAVELGAVVLDYDGTLCATRERFDPMPKEIGKACARLLGMGLLLGIATGRGQSARRALRDALPRHYWDSVIVGYYNGGDVASLTDDAAPDKSRPEDSAIAAIRAVLDADPLLEKIAAIEARPSQISITPTADARPLDLPTYVMDLVQSARAGVRFHRSGHSIDLVAPKVSKLRVVELLANKVSPRSILCIGDRGAWPGNDAQLLSHEISLSVDQVSAGLHSCWNLAPSGVLGPQATLLYLSAITNDDGVVQVDSKKILRGAS